MKNNDGENDDGVDNNDDYNVDDVMILKVVVVFVQGVGSVNWDNVDFVVKDEFSIPCSTLPEPVGSKSFYQSLLAVSLMSTIVTVSRISLNNSGRLLTGWHK